MIKKCNNYHSHKMYSNVKSLDVVAKPIEYIVRAIELDGKEAIYFTTEHGYQGNVYEAHTLCNEVCVKLTQENKEYTKYNCDKCKYKDICDKSYKGIKMVVGAEVYYVKNRKEKDSSNYHLIIIAKNKEGYKDLNRILSYSNIDGIYYKNRIDDELLFSINPNNVIITSACVAGRLRDDEGLDDWVIKMKNYFGNNFYLEVQNHNEDIQKNLNKKVIYLSEKYNINIIHGNDSHYIKPQDYIYRELFLKAKGIVYKEETNFILDYPNVDTIIERYNKQNVLNKEQIEKAINNTLIFDECENIILDKEIKMPSISNNPNKELKDIINERWIALRDTIPQDRWDEYLEAIRYEFNIIEKTHMEDYFILDYRICQRAINEYNGLLTKTGRGSAVSFLINKLLGLTEIDRLSAPVPLYPTRFMSIERILGTRSLPDVDLNTEDRSVFIQATKDLLGEENCAWILSYKPLQDASAFRLWCKANDMHVSKYDEIAKNLEQYEEDEYWGKIIKDSKVFKGVVESISESPCSMLLYDKNVAEEIGLIKTKEGLCCNLDGYNCDVYKYLKNDYLAVTVWTLIRKTCELANIKIPTIKELESMLDEKTFKIYEDKITCTINQSDSDFATNLVSRYKVSSVAEMSAFVASIRPGFASLLDNFIDRKPYSTGVEALDDILEDSYHYLLYQESIMKYLIWLGIPEPETYGIIKKISKKKFKEKELKDLEEKLKKGWINKVGSIDGFEETWQVVNDASRYSFNASHSLSYAYDSLYGAFLKSHYPLEYYTVALSIYSDDSDRTNRLIKELNYFNIELLPPKFRYSRAEYFMDKETNSIYKGMASIKYMNAQVSEELYKLKDNQYNNFMDLLIDVYDKTSINSRQLSILIVIDFFEEFGKSQKLLDIVELYENIMSKKLKSKKGEVSFNKADLPYPQEIIEKYATEKSKEDKYKQYKVERALELCNELMNDIPNIEMPSIYKIRMNFDTMGECNYYFEDYNPTTCIVVDVITKFKTKKAWLFNIASGHIAEVNIGEGYYNLQPFKALDVIDVFEITQKPKKERREVEVEDKNGNKVTKMKYVPTGEMRLYLSEYHLLDKEEIDKLNEEEKEYREGLLYED